MPQNITDVDEFTSPVEAPAGADVQSSANMLALLQKYANRTRWLEKRLRSSLYHPPLNWDEIDFGSGQQVNDIAEDSAGLIIAVGNHGTTTTKIFKSVDFGRTFTAVTTPDAGAEVFNHVHWGGGWWIAGGTAGSGDPIIYRSSDGTTWTVETPAVAAFAVEDGTYVSVDDAHVLIAASTGTNARAWRSTDDGDTWTEINLSAAVGSGNVRRIVYSVALDRLVAVGDGGTIITSDDGGSTWTARTSGTSEHLFGIALHPRDGKFHVVGQNGVHRVSTDGITWSAGGALGTTPDWGGIATLGGLLVVGGRGNGTLGDSTIAVSVDDGATWQSFQVWRMPGTGNQIVMETVRAVRNRIWVVENRYVQRSHAFGEGTTL